MKALNGTKVNIPGFGLVWLHRRGWKGHAPVEMAKRRRRRKIAHESRRKNR